MFRPWRLPEVSEGISGEGVQLQENFGKLGLDTLPVPCLERQILQSLPRQLLQKQVSLQERLAGAVPPVDLGNRKVGMLADKLQISPLTQKMMFRCPCARFAPTFLRRVLGIHLHNGMIGGPIKAESSHIGADAHFQPTRRFATDPRANPWAKNLLRLALHKVEPVVRSGHVTPQDWALSRRLDHIIMQPRFIPAPTNGCPGTPPSGRPVRRRPRSAAWSFAAGWPKLRLASAARASPGAAARRSAWGPWPCAACRGGPAGRHRPPPAGPAWRRAGPRGSR